MRVPGPVIALVLLALLPAAAAAAGQPHRDYGTSILFARLDSNDNAILDRSEAAGWTPLDAHFAQADRNHDLQIGRAEFDAYRRRQMAAAPPEQMPRNVVFPNTRGAAGAAPGAPPQQSAAQ